MNGKAFGLACCLGFLSLLPRSARAELPEGEIHLRKINQSEPRPGEVVRAALRYFHVHPEHVDSLRSNTNLRGLLPVLSGYMAFDQYGTQQVQSTTGVNPNDVRNNTGNVGVGVTAGASWDLREIVFNPAEVQVYGLVGIQKDIMLEVLRAYYLRRQLQIRLAVRPPGDPIVRLTLELLVEQFGAVMDAMSGGWFSKTMMGMGDPSRTIPRVTD